jgi:zinc transporter 1
MSALELGSDTNLSVDTTKGPAHHEHRHKTAASESTHHHDFGMAGVILHVAGDAVNNVGVILAGLIVWKTNHPGRFYADPAVSMFIALMILISALPLGKFWSLVTNYNKLTPFQ